MESPLFSKLSISSRSMLMWAGALSRYRAEQRGEDPSSAAADAFDLLVGMMLQHPDDSEPMQLLKHFHLSPGQALPPDYPHPLPEAIERHMRMLRADEPPPLQQDAEMVVEMGVKNGLSTGNPEVAELRALFGALLTASTPATSLLGDLISQRGIDLSSVARATQEYVAAAGKDKATYSQFLQQRFPYNPQPVDIPNYKADHGQKAALADDMVGIRAEVDAFAYLLASRGLKPPLAVGLFGDWGSGKSFFMDAVRERIDQLTHDADVVKRKQADVPFWKRIIQIQFNAWHYVEGELWASLVDHIFNELRMKDETEDLVKQRREHWLEKLDHTRAKMVRLEARRNEAERNLRDKEQQAEMLRRQRDSELDNLERLKAQATTDMVVESSLDEVNRALKPFLIAVGVPTVQEVFNKLDEARAELKRGRVLLTAIWNDDQQRLWVLASMVGVPALVWLLSLLDFSALTTAFSGLSAAAGAIITTLSKATGLMQSRLAVIEDAQSKVNQEIISVQQSLNTKIKQAEGNINKAETQLQSVVKEQQSLAAGLKTIQKQLKEVTPARVLNDFVAERVGSGDYRKHLGIPALIQQDFRQLANLVGQQNEAILKDKKGKLEKREDCFNRIILYIDDLDRCPDEHVVEVLQAVHLLLAFELFVVVVAVDSRWLSHALTKHFEALVVDRANGQEATPDDYLEKIFQIPFWIQPLSKIAKQNIIQGLLQGHLTTPESQGGEETKGDKPTVGKQQVDVLLSLDPSTAPPNLQAAALSITHEELSFLDSLAILMGTTPRSTKRFVNLYQLVRIIYRLDPTAFTPTPPAEYELLAFALALGEGLPKLGPTVLKAAVTAKPAATFDTLLSDCRDEVDELQLGLLDSWLIEYPAWKQIPAARMADAFRKIERFLFRVGSHLQPKKPDDA